MDDNVKIGKNSAILFARLIITTLVGLISSRIVLQNLGASDYGLYAVVGGIVVMLNVINTTMTATTYRFIAFEMGKKNGGRVNTIFNVSLIIHLAIAILILLFAETLGKWYILNELNIPLDKVPVALFVFRFSIIAVFFTIISIPFQGLVTAIEKFEVRATIEIVRSLLKLVLVLTLIYYSGNKLELYAVLMMITSIIPAFLFFVYCFLKQSKIIKWNFQSNIGEYKEMLKYSSWISLGATANVGKTQASSLIINAFFGTVINASYGIATQLNSFIVMFATNLSQVIVPQITKSYSAGNEKRTYDLVIYISKYSLFLMLPIAVPLLLRMDFVLSLWLGEVPPFTVELSRLLILNTLFDSLGYGFFSIIAATGRIRNYQIVFSILLLSGLPLLYLLYSFGKPPYYVSIVYIGISFLLIQVQLLFLKKTTNFNIKKLFNISYKHILYVLVLIAPLYFINLFFNNNIYSFGLLTLICLIWILSVIAITGLTKREKEFFTLKLRELKKHYL